jgi:hypothetical protein
MEGTNLSRTVPLPVDGRALYVRLWSLMGGNWQFNDYSYRAYSGVGFVGLGSVLPPGALNGGYNQTLQASGGTGPYTWSWSGSTPPGLTLSTGGSLGGTPTALGTYNFTLGVQDSLGSTVTQAVSLAVQGQDLSHAMVGKVQQYWQTNAGAAALPSPALNPNPFEFVALVKQSPTGTVTSATVQLPDTTTQTLPLLTPPAQGADFLFSAPFATKAAMDAAFSNGLYTLTIAAAHDGTNTLPVSMTGDNYPGSAPHISNWAAAQAVNPAASFTLAWDPLPGATTNDSIVVQIKDQAGTNRLFETAPWGHPAALNGTRTSVVIPAGTLITNQTYQAEVWWGRFVALNTTHYPGATGGIGYARETRFFINTTAPAQMLSPTNNSALASNVVTFNWSSGAGVSQYALWIGRTVGGYDLAAISAGTNLSQTVTLSAGGLIYVRLWSQIGGGWQFNDYSYTVPAPRKAVMLSPVNGSTNRSASATFVWDAGVGVSQYALWAGSSVGSSDLYAQVESGLSRTLAVPVDGRTLYVRLWSLLNGAWDYNDYNYPGFKTVKARFTGLANGATLGASSVTLTWDAGTGVSQYALWAGTTPGGYDLYALGLGTNLTRTLTLPSNGGKLYLTLWSLISGFWKFNSYEFTAYTAPSARAQMISPTNGVTLTSTPVTFTWSGGVGVSQYALWVGSTGAGSHDLGALGVDTNLTHQLSVPLDGTPIYVRLWSLIGETWECNDYMYDTTPGGGGKAKMLSPANGATLGAALTTFTWDRGVGVSQYALWVGSDPGDYDLYAALESGQSRALLLPADGGPIYVRLWSLMSGTWKFSDYFYTTYLSP